MNPEIKKHSSLNPLPVDKRDLSTHRVLGSVVPTALPTDSFLVYEPIEYKNQDINYNSDFCAAYAGTEASENEDNVICVPEYSFAKAKQILAAKLTDPTAIANIINGFGLNLRDICNAGVQYGFLERAHDPFGCDTIHRPDRNFIADWRNWPQDLDMLAWEHAKNSYLAVTGPYDMFDNMRSTLAKNRATKEGIITGALWRASWSTALGGVITKDTYSQSEGGSGHAFVIIGQSMTEVGLCLVAQLSDTDKFGDHGKFYFTRDVINAEFSFGAFTLSNIPKATAQVHNDYNFTVDAGTFEKLIKIVLYFIKNYIVITK